MRPAFLRAGLPLLLLPLLSLPSCRERRELVASLPADRTCRWEEAGRLALDAGDAGRALERFLAAIAVRELRGDRRWEVSDRNFAGLALRRLNRLGEARRQFELAARLAAESGYPPGEAAAFNNLALLAEEEGHFAQARLGYRRALLILSEAGGENAGEAATGEAALYRENLARLLVVEGDLAEAERLLQPAAGAAPSASALAELAWLQLLRQEPSQALATLDRALELGEDAFTEGVIQDRRGTALEQLGRPGEAGEAYREALRLAAGRPSATAATLASLCRLAVLHRDQERKGEDSCATAVSAAGAPGVPPAMLASSHYWQARRWREEGRLREAQESARRAAGLVGGLRGAASSPDRASRFLEDRAAYWSLAIALSMELHDREPDRGFDRVALEDSERWRARGLIDQLGALAEPFDLAALQSQLDPETYAFSLVLGGERSFLWRIGAHSVDSYRLPPAGEIETWAERYFALLAAAGEAPRRGAALEAGVALAELLFGPRLARLEGSRRLVFVGDGILAPYPLAALPAPLSTPTEPYFLVEQLEIAQLPSLGSLEALRRPRPEAQLPNGGLALIGDPWYDAALWQDKLQLERLAAAEIPSWGGAPPPFPLGRLPFAASEMERVAAHWPPGEGPLLRAAGLAATRELALSEEIARFSIVHFSAHGDLESGPPAIVLSALDRAGRLDLRGGRLSPADLAGRGWAAELVVASSCESASGSFRFEGVGGLARGFLEAGAKRTLASLWKVEGDATGALMDRFYAGLIGRRLPPAEALRAAQRGLLAEAREQGTAWRAPYYWSGFVLIGDWRAFSLR